MSLLLVMIYQYSKVWNAILASVFDHMLTYSNRMNYFSFFIILILAFLIDDIGSTIPKDNKQKDDAKSDDKNVSVKSDNAMNSSVINYVKIILRVLIDIGVHQPDTARFVSVLLWPLSASVALFLAPIVIPLNFAQFLYRPPIALLLYYLHPLVLAPINPIMIYNLYIVKPASEMLSILESMEPHQEP